MRETAIASMNKRIEEPDFPITHLFFFTLSFLHVTPGSEKESIRKATRGHQPGHLVGDLLRRHEERSGGEGADGANPSRIWTKHLDSGSEAADGFAVKALVSRSG
jgi:hypothetical protein